MLLTSPLAVTLGLSLTIPLAIAGDLYRSAPVTLFSFIGGVLVLGSFVGNGMMDLKAAEEGTLVASELLTEDLEGNDEREALLSREGSDEEDEAGEREGRR